MRYNKNYRIIDIPVGCGGVLHSLYVKEHNNPGASSTAEGSSGSLKGRTLFIANVDYGLERTHEEIDGYLRDLFSAFGEVESVSVSKLRKRKERTSSVDDGEDAHEHDDDDDDADDYSCCQPRVTVDQSRFAHLVFTKKSSLKAALAASDSEYYELTKPVAKKWGVAELCRPKNRSELLEMFVYSPPDQDDLQREVEDYMKEYDEGERVAKQERDRLAREPDEDGFVMVKQRNKRARTDDEKRGTGAPRDRTGKKEKKKNKAEKELKNFYRFQVREEKENKLAELRRKFEEDKQKIAAMKAARKFNPF